MVLLLQEGVTWVVNVDKVWLWRSEEIRHRMPGAVPRQGVPPESETVFGLRIGPTMVSDLREAPFASVWVPS